MFKFFHFHQNQMIFLHFPFLSHTIIATNKYMYWMLCFLFFKMRCMLAIKIFWFFYLVLCCFSHSVRFVQNSFDEKNVHKTRFLADKSEKSWSAIHNWSAISTPNIPVLQGYLFLHLHILSPIFYIYFWIIFFSFNTLCAVFNFSKFLPVIIHKQDEVHLHRYYYC